MLEKRINKKYIERKRAPRSERVLASLITVHIAHGILFINISRQMFYCTIQS